jgi:PD-(D/E)XK endonuclease
MRNRRRRTGDIGEAAFVLKATQLGLQVAKPLSGKEGYDYITHDGHTASRVQIKTTATRASKGAYHVSTARGARKLTPYKKNEIDYFVIYVLPEDTFYILPQKALPDA